MSAMEYFCKEIGIDPRKLSKEENQILEAELYSRIREQILDDFKNQYSGYFFLFYKTKMDDNMTDINFLRVLINDLLKNDFYTISGIASYTQTPEEIIHDLIISSHSSHVLSLPRKIIELHRTIYQDLYKKVLNKAMTSQIT